MKSTLVDFNFQEHPHQRYNPLKGEWVLVSPHRMQRPWHGSTEPVKKTPGETPASTRNSLAPGGVRTTGEMNPNYSSVYVFVNDFPAMMEDSPAPPESDDPLFQIKGASGTCRVICFHPDSNITIAKMTQEEILTVINTWIQETVELGDRYEWVQIFENRGEAMGCSNPHPHCQVWASAFLPNEAFTKDKHQLDYFNTHGRALLMDYAEQELIRKERVVYCNEEWVIVVPYWAVWPYETLVLPRRQARRFYDLDSDQRSHLADAIKTLTIKYDNLFKTSFPYSMGWHGAPTGKYTEDAMDHWVFHGIYYPPLLRSATVKKFMVGYEMLAQCQRDLTPEAAAKALAELPSVRFNKAKDNTNLSSISFAHP